MSTDEFFNVLWRRRWWALATFAATMIAAGLVTFSLPNVYKAKAYLLVQPERPAGNDFDATQISTTLNTTYSELLDTRNVVLAVERALAQDKALPREYSHSVAGNVTIEPISESQLISIQAEGASPRAAKTIADTYAEVFADLARDFKARGIASGTVSVAVKSSLATAAARPRPKLYMALAAMLASLLAAAAAVIRNRLDQRLDVSASTTELLGLPVIARIPQRSASALRSLTKGGVATDPDARVLAEAFRLLLANLSFANVGERPKTIAVLSSAASEGKSITALSLGRAAGELGIETLLVDADLRRPGLTEKLADEFDPNEAAGLSSFLVRSTLSLSEALTPLESPHLSLVPAGPIPPNPAALLGSKMLPEFDRRTTRAYEFVIYDTPPLSIGADASLVATNAEGVILVVDVRNSRRKVVVQAVDQLRRSRANILGIVLNRMPESDAGYYGYYGDAEQFGGMPEPPAAS